MSPSASRDYGFEDINTPHPTARATNAALLADVGATNWGLHAQRPNPTREAMCKDEKLSKLRPWRSLGDWQSSCLSGSFHSIIANFAKSKLGASSPACTSQSSWAKQSTSAARENSEADLKSRDASLIVLVPLFLFYWFMCSISRSGTWAEAPPLYFGGMGGLLGCWPLQFPMKWGVSCDTISVSLNVILKQNHLFVIDLSYTVTEAWVLLDVVAW